MPLHITHIILLHITHIILLHITHNTSHITHSLRNEVPHIPSYNTPPHNTHPYITQHTPSSCTPLSHNSYSVHFWLIKMLHIFVLFLIDFFWPTRSEQNVGWCTSCIIVQSLKGYSSQWEIHSIYSHMYNIFVVQSYYEQRSLINN